MDFKTAFAHYTEGCAADEERRLVETELEKYELISQHLDAQWNQFDPQLSTPEPEVVKMNKRLRRQNAALVLTSLALVAALLITSVIGFAPTIAAKLQESQRHTVEEKLEENKQLEAQAEAAYWDPNETRFHESVTDLQLTIAAYNELFCPGYDVNALWITKTGFAAYSLVITRSNAQSDLVNTAGTLIEGALRLDMDLALSRPAVNIFYGFGQPETLELAVQDAAALPEFVDIYAAVSFSDDLTVKELIALKEKYGLQIEWSAVDVGERDYGPCGMDVFSGGGLSYDLSASRYPDFSARYGNSTPAQLENHFKTLLKLSADRLAEGKGISVSELAPDFYANALEYVETNGIRIYGCFLVASPSTLLQLIEDGVVNGICIEDAWIGI